MEDIDILKKLEKLNIDFTQLQAPEVSNFLDLAQNIKDSDYEYAIDFVSTREKLKDKTGMDRFKYLCGYLQRLKKVYQYQKDEEERNNTR